MMQYVYLLSDHDEGGSDNVVATLDREALIALVDIQASDGQPGCRSDLSSYRDEAKTSLAKLLERSDEDLASEQKHCLMRGWGGMQLHVVKLEF